MGNKKSILKDHEIEEYQDCTFFSRKEISSVFDRFKELAEQIYGIVNSQNAKQVKIPPEVIKGMPELKENPFRDRICNVFSSRPDGCMDFDDFLNMFSVFSEAATRDIKTAYAFRIYDHNGDNFIDEGDLDKTVRCLTNKDTGETDEQSNNLTDEEIRFVVKKVLDETDLDSDGQLSFVEFEHVISRAPEFLSTFHIRILRA